MKNNLILQKVDFLYGTLHPDWVDGGPGQPGGPLFSSAIVDVMLASLLREIGTKIQNQELGGTIVTLGKEMVANAAQGLVNGWEDGDDICPPWPFPFPWPFPWPIKPDPREDPLPEPWLERISNSMQDLVLAHAMRDIASLTNNEKFSMEVKNLGEKVVQDVSGKLFDEYCGTPVKPRRIPRRIR